VLLTPRPHPPHPLSLPRIAAGTPLAPSTSPPRPAAPSAP
jgi:hypothetical protein